MSFAPASYFFGPNTESLTFEISDHQELPDGIYKVIDLYCVDSKCDCRKTIFDVYHDGGSIGQIDYGWESPRYYRKWMRADKELANQMAGWSPSPLCDHKLDPNLIIELLKDKMEDRWIEEIKERYNRVKRQTRRPHKTTPSSTKPSRNEPCFCGSGKKYKRCCMGTSRDQFSDNDGPMANFGFSLGEDLMMPFHEEEESEVDKSVDRAIDRLSESDFKGAGEILFSLLEKHQSESVVFYGIGLFYAMQGEYEDSISFFQEAVELDPEFAEAWHNLGISNQKMMKTGDALICAVNAINFGEPQDSFYAENQRFVFGIESVVRERYGFDLDEYIENSFRFDDACAAMQEGSLEEAIERFHTVLEKTPDNYASHGNLAICYAMQGKKEMALRAFDKALEINPDYELARENKPHIEALKEGVKLILPEQNAK